MSQTGALVVVPAAFMDKCSSGIALTDTQSPHTSHEKPPRSFSTAEEPINLVEGVGNAGITRYGDEGHKEIGPTSQEKQIEGLKAAQSSDDILDIPSHPIIVSTLEGDHQPGSDVPILTPISDLQPPLEARQPEGWATPPKSFVPASSPLSKIASSSPLSSPKLTPKDDNSFVDSSGQANTTNEGDTCPSEQATTRQRTTESEKSPQPLRLSTESVKENRHPRNKVRDSNASLKTYEASSNLSKSSPNHPTASSQSRSTKKIRTAFRSPLFNKTLGGSGDITALFAKDGLRSDLESASGGVSLKKRGPVARIKGTGTTAARAAFKSPLRTGTGAPKPETNAPSSSRKAFPRNDPLRDRLQLLRRAVKIKESKEDEKLEGLVRKWREVAREVAWELWGFVKEGSVGEGSESHFNTGPGGAGGFGSFGNGWDNSGFGDDGAKKNWGWDTGGEGDTTGESRDTLYGRGSDTHDEEGEEERKVEERTMGTMLRQLGIAEETLGWDEGEGDFTEIRT